MIGPSDLPLRIVRATAEDAEVAVRLDPAFAGFDGHFPGDPVLPAMCHVDLAVRAASAVLGVPLALSLIERARFIRRTLPGEEMTIRLHLGAPQDGATPIVAEHSVGADLAAHLHLRVRSPRA